jgi:hypothetical protein
MGEGVQRQDPGFLDHLEQRQGEIARDAEDPGRTMILERLEEGLSEVHCGHPLYQGSSPT